MLGNKDAALGLEIIANRARSAAKALAMVAEEVTRSRSHSGKNGMKVSITLDDDQLGAFMFLVDQVVGLTRDASDATGLLVQKLGEDAEPGAANQPARRPRDAADTVVMTPMKAAVASL